MTNISYFAQKAFIVDRGRLLAIQKSEDDPHNPGLWEVPGGRMDFGEDVDSHLRREVREEVGLEIKPGRPFYIWQWVLDINIEDCPGKMQIVAVARECAVLSGRLDISGQVEDDYVGKAIWIPISAISDLQFIPNMEPVITEFLDMRE